MISSRQQQAAKCINAIGLSSKIQLRVIGVTVEV